MTRGTMEVETKFSVHGLFVVPDLVDPDAGIATVKRLPPMTLRATYVDTESLRLAREGITLRYRTGEGAPLWTLKLPSRGSGRKRLTREEISVPGSAAAVPDELRDLLIAVLRGEPLRPVAVLRTQRESLAMLDAAGGQLGEVVDDTVSLLEGRRVASRFREIEIEQGGTDDAAAACRAAGRRLRVAGAVAGEQLPKVVRALGPKAQEPSELPAPPVVDADSPAADLVRWSLRHGLQRLVATDIGVRRSESDAVHQMRVACRRLRSDLRTFEELIDDPRVGPLREELKWLAGALGDARDLEVLLVRVGRTAASDPLAPLDDDGLAAVRRLLQTQEDAALAVTRDALGAPRYVALLRSLVDVAAEPQLTEQSDQPCRDVLPTLVGRTWQKLAKRAGTLHEVDPDEDWHRARILAKRARYAAEVAAVALGKPAKRTGSAAAHLQEVLGEHQDAAVAAERFGALALLEPTDPVLALTCGRLVERERAHVHAARAAFGQAWRDVRRDRTTRWMHP